MYKIIFYNNNDNLFHNSIHHHLKGAMQIIIESNLDAYIIDNNSGEILFEYNKK